MTKTHTDVSDTFDDTTKFSERLRKAGIYVTNIYNLSSEVIPEDYVKAIGVGWPWLLLV